MTHRADLARRVEAFVSAVEVLLSDGLLEQQALYHRRRHEGCPHDPALAGRALAVFRNADGYARCGRRADSARASVLADGPALAADLAAVGHPIPELYVVLRAVAEGRLRFSPRPGWTAGDCLPCWAACWPKLRAAADRLAGAPAVGLPARLLRFGAGGDDDQQQQAEAGLLDRLAGFFAAMLGRPSAAKKKAGPSDATREKLRRLEAAMKEKPRATWTHWARVAGFPSEGAARKAWKRHLMGQEEADI